MTSTFTAACFLSATAIAACANQAESQVIEADMYLKDRLLIESGTNTGWMTGDTLNAFLCIKKNGVLPNSINFEWWGSNKYYPHDDRVVLQSGEKSTFLVEANYTNYGVTATYSNNNEAFQLDSEIVACNVDSRSGKCYERDNSFLTSEQELGLCKLIVRETGGPVRYRMEVAKNPEQSIYRDSIIPLLKIDEAQSFLQENGYNPGPVDGVYGRKTEASIIEFLATKNNQLTSFDFSKFIYQKIHNQIEPFAIDIVNATDKKEIFVNQYENQNIAEISYAVGDFDNNGKLEIILSGVNYPTFADAFPVVLEINNNNLKALDVKEYFKNNPPTINAGGNIELYDLNSDGWMDVLFADAGMDAPPWTGTAPEILLGSETGLVRITGDFEKNVWGERAYAIAAGNFFELGISQVILPGTQVSDLGGRNSKIIVFSDDSVDVLSSPLIGYGLWEGKYSVFSDIQIFDIDSDGFEDIYIGASPSWESGSEIIFGPSNSPQKIVLPQMRGYSGWIKPPYRGGAEVNTAAFIDVDGNGLKDVILKWQAIDSNLHDAFVNDQSHYLQLLLQTSRRVFVDATPIDNFLGDSFASSENVVDLNNDSKDDIVFNGFYINSRVRGSNDLQSQIFLSGEDNYYLVPASAVPLYRNRGHGLIIPLYEVDHGYRILVYQSYSDGGNRKRVTYYFADLVSY